jgi:hypothetical protein
MTTPIIIKPGEQVQQPAQVPAAQRLAVFIAREQLNEKHAPCCVKAMSMASPTTSSHLTHWLMNMPCQHTRLCLICDPCATCGTSFWRCRHCGPQLCPACRDRLDANGNALRAAAERVADSENRLQRMFNDPEDHCDADD